MEENVLKKFNLPELEPERLIEEPELEKELND